MHIKIDEPGIAAPGDAVLIRSFSPVTTVAGGKVLYIDPPGIRQIESNWKEIFGNLSNNDLLKKVKQIFEFQGYKSQTIKAIRLKLFETESVVIDVLDRLIKQKYLTKFTYKNETHYVSYASMDMGIKIIKSEIEKVHEKNKLKCGHNFQQLLNIFKTYGFNEPFLERTLERAVKSGNIMLKGSEYNTQTASENDEMNKIRQKIIELYKQSRYAAPDLNEIAHQLNLEIKTMKKLMISLTQTEELKSIGGKFYIHREVLNELLEFIKHHFRESSELDVAVLRDFTGCSRKYIIPIFEYLDANKFTERQGDVRVAGSNL
jgi:selenocysteine-specific elongation factor